MLIPLRATCRTIARPSILLPKLAPQVNLFPNQLVRHKTSKRKRKLKAGEEKAADRRLRLKKQFKKDMEKKHFNHEKRMAADRAKFRLPPHEPRPDAVPFGTAIRLLRGWLAPADIFVRSKAAPWAPETMVIAMVRVVPNDNNPRTLRGRVKFPHPVVDKSKEGKKERIVAIAEGAAANQARQAGMVVGGQDYLDKIVKMVSANETLPFDILLATPETEKLFRRHGRVLGPKGLMPSDKRGTVISDFAAYGTRVEKGIELKVDAAGKSKKGAMLRVVVGKFKQDDHDILANIKALIGTIHRLGVGTLIPLELFLYSSVHRSIVKSTPLLTVGSTAPVSSSISNASPMVPIADFPAVGHPRHLVPRRTVRRYIASAGWLPVEGHTGELAAELARYNTAIQNLKKAKSAHDLETSSRREDRSQELAAYADRLASRKAFPRMDNGT